jgi:hypothetical protein
MVKVKIGQAYQPRLPNRMDQDACLIQWALIGRKRGWFARLLEWVK